MWMRVRVRVRVGLKVKEIEIERWRKRGMEKMKENKVRYSEIKVENTINLLVP